MKPALVKYSCGCIGAPPLPSGIALILNACDADEGPSFALRDMSGKTFQLCPEDVQKEIINRLRSAVRKAAEYDALKMLLRNLISKEI